MPITDLISSECPLRSLEADAPKPACCELVKEPAEAEEPNESAEHNGPKAPQEEHWWLDPRLIENLPVNIKKGKDSHPRATDVDREIPLVIETKETLIYL